MAPARVAVAQQEFIRRIELSVGRSFPLTTISPITQVSIANPEVADVLVIRERELVINAKREGETDAILWPAAGERLHYRISVHSPADRMQIALYVKFAEVRRDLLREIGISGLYKEPGDVRVGTGVFRGGGNLQNNEEGFPVSGASRFLTILSDFNTDRLLGFLDAEAQRGNARILSEPSILAANKDSATFLAGGELPIPVAQGGLGADVGSARVTIEYREFGVRLKFIPEILSDSLIKLYVRPEVSRLDFGNAVLISGFRIPALRTHRVETSLDVRRSQSLIISGLFNTEEERVRTGIPFLMDIPILGQLFSSTRFQKNETELIVVVTPVVIDPMRPRAQDVLRFVPDTTRPAGEALQRRLEPPPSRRESPPPR